MAKQGQTLVRVTVRNEEEGTPTTFGEPRWCRTVRKEIFSDAHNYEGDKAGQDINRSHLQKQRMSEFEVVREQRKWIRNASTEANLFRSGSRIYGGLGRKTNWICGEEKITRAARRFPETHEIVVRESQNLLFIDRKIAAANDDENESDSNAATADLKKSSPDVQKEKVLNDILSHGLSDDSHDSSLCQHCASHSNHAAYYPQSDLERQNGPEHRMDHRNLEPDSKHLEMIANIPENKFLINGRFSAESAVNPQLCIEANKPPDGDILGACDVEADQIKQEEIERENDETLCRRHRNLKPLCINKWDSKLPINTASDCFEPDSWKSSKHRTNLHHHYYRQGSLGVDRYNEKVFDGSKHHISVSLKGTRKRDSFAGNSRHECKARSFDQRSVDVSSARIDLENDLAMPHASDSETILSFNSSDRTSSRTLDVEVKKLQLHSPDPTCHKETLGSYRGKENAEHDAHKFMIGVQKSKLHPPIQQKKSVIMEFKEKCSIKPSAKRELVLGADQSMKPNDQILTDRKRESIFDDEITRDFKCKVNDYVCKALEKCTIHLQTALPGDIDVDKLPKDEQMTSQIEKSSSQLQTWRASKVAKLGGGCQLHKSLKELADSTNHSNNGVMPRKVSVEDFSHKFRLKHESCIQKQPKEHDVHRISQRSRQINFGKNTLGYERYINLVPRRRRVKSEPHTPEIHQVCSKRSWDGQVSKWRRCLHFYDTPVQEDEEFPEEIGAIIKAGVDIQDNEEQVSAFLPAEEDMVKDGDLSIYGDWMDFGPADEGLFQESDMLDTK
ncbi:hypothetical protein O6H91_Y336400 [Diphasiastrum complanatum]|nr:hypothetical protein O6H91_Y336400 [Diphasiastrum complanatum]